MLTPNKLTEDVLKCISSHLSSRLECRKQEYIVQITQDTITCSINIHVFPDRLHRKETDKDTVLYHVLYYHFPQLLDETESTKSISTRIKQNQLVCGTYMYKYPYERKQRHWTKVHPESLEYMI